MRCLFRLSDRLTMSSQSSMPLIPDVSAAPAVSTIPAFVGVTGLPRAGSTLLCQLLAQHPDVQCEGASSPLCNTLLGMRRLVSDDTFFLSQLDHAFERSYVHLKSAMQGSCEAGTRTATRR